MSHRFPTCSFEEAMRATPILPWPTALELRDSRGQLCNYSPQACGPDSYLPHQLFSEKNITRCSDFFKRPSCTSSNISVLPRDTLHYHIYDFFFFLNIVGTPHYISFRYTIKWFDIYIHEKSSTHLFVHLFCFLGPTYKWNHMVCVFVWHISLSTIPSSSICVIINGKIHMISCERCSGVFFPLVFQTMCSGGLPMCLALLQAPGL